MKPALKQRWMFNNRLDHCVGEIIEVSPQCVKYKIVQAFSSRGLRNKVSDVWDSSGLLCILTGAGDETSSTYWTYLEGQDAI